MLFVIHSFGSVSSSFIFECVLLAALKEVLHPLLVPIWLWVSHAGEDGIENPPEEIDVLVGLPPLNRTWGAEAVCVHGGAGMLLG